MIIGACSVYMTAGWSRSLKEKRSEVKSLIGRAKNKFNISIAEIEDMDSHKKIAIGFACVSNETRHADSVIRNVLRFIESSTDARVDDVVIEFL